MSVRGGGEAPGSPRRARIVVLTAAALLVGACAADDEGVAGREPQTSGQSSAPPAQPGIEAVGAATMSFGFETVTDDDLDLVAVDAELTAMGVDTIAVSAGRADWAAFAWPGHEDRQAPAVASAAQNGNAPFDRMVDALGEDRNVVAVVDVFVGRYLAENPDAAARDADGNASDFQVSLTELTEGGHGDALLGMVEELAGRPEVDAVTLTELQYDDHGLGEDDLASFHADTGQDDWPRDADGDVDWHHPQVAAWRSQRITDFIAEARDVAHEEGAELLIDVRAPREGGTAVFGQDYALLNEAADGLIVWYYPGLRDDDGTAWSMARTVAHLSEEEGIDEDRVVLSVGLWAGRDALPADRMAKALDEAQAAGFGHLWVTPYSLVTESHHAVLAEREGVS